MSPSSNSLSSESSNTVSQYLKHVINELERFELLPFHVLHLYLSNSESGIQNIIAPTDTHLLQILRAHPDLFEINRMLEVCCIKSNNQMNMDRFSDGNGSVFPKQIKNGRGRVSRLFSTYGFIQAYAPFKTGVYFTSRILSESYELSPLNMSEFRVGQTLGFDADFGNRNNNPYRATKIWCVIDEEDDDEEDPFSCENRTSKSSHKFRNVNESKKTVPKAYSYNKSKKPSFNNNETVVEGKVFYSKDRNLSPNYAKYEKSEPPPPQVKAQFSSKKNIKPETVNEEGIVNNVFGNYGFISCKANNSKVFFTLKNMNLPKVYDLRTILSIGDAVNFTAEPSSKRNTPVSWQATSVSLKNPRDNGVQSLSSEESNTEESVPFQDERDGDQKKTFEKSSSASVSETKGDYLQNCPGKIYPQSDVSALIKFGVQYREVAEAEDCFFFMGGSPVTDIKWEFQDGDLILFDAVKKTTSANFIWVASVVWQGDKPVVPKFKSEVHKPELSQEINGENESETKLASSGSASARTVQNPVKLDWGDSPYPEEEGLDECSTIDSEYSSAESHLSSSRTTSQSKKVSQSNEIEVSSNTKTSELRHVDNYKDNANAFANEEYYNINTGSKKNIVNNHSLPNKRINRSEDHKRNSRKKKTFETKEISQNNLDLNCGAFSDRDSPLNSNKENDFSDTESAVGADREEKFKPTNESNRGAQNISNHHEGPSNNALPSIKPPGVLMFENEIGKIVTVYRIHLDVECLNINKRLALIWNDLYYDGQVIREKCRDLKELLHVEDTINLNFFEITDDEGSVFRKVTLAWIGTKPQNIKQMEPKDYIDNEQLHVSCKIPTRKSYNFLSKKQTDRVAEKVQADSDTSLEREGLRLLNKNNENSDNIPVRKNPILSVVSTSIEENGNRNQNVDSDVHRGLDEIKIKSNPAAISDALFARIRQLRRSCDEIKSLKIIDALENDIEVAIKVFQPYLPASDGSKVGKCLCRDSSCQTTQSIDPRNQHTFQDTSINGAEHRDIVSTAMQTVITGNVISTGIFPH